MTLQGAIEWALPQLRAEALGRMVSRCTIRRDSGTTQPHPVTGRQVKVWDTTHADLPCRLAGSRNAGTSIQKSSSGVDVELATREIHLPHETADLADDDLIEIVTGERAGTIWRLIDIEGADQQTALRLPAIQTRRPTDLGW